MRVANVMVVPIPGALEDPWTCMSVKQVSHSGQCEMSASVDQTFSGGALIRSAVLTEGILR